jgi:hypothetical protein
MNLRRWIMFAALGLAALGCDGKDPERLNRVGKKIVEKSHTFADDANLPQVSVTRPHTERQAPAASIRGRNDPN